MNWMRPGLLWATPGTDGDLHKHPPTQRGVLAWSAGDAQESGIGKHEICFLDAFNGGGVALISVMTLYVCYDALCVQENLLRVDTGWET